jgi:nucleoside-diphosphate kinase
MAGDITFTMVKPRAVRDEHIGEILEMINTSGFHFVAIKTLKMTLDQAQRFYKVHEDKPFFKDLTEFMSSGNIVVAILQKENAVAAYRKLIGPTDYTKAEEGTIRRKFAKSIQENAVHGSDSDENALIEAGFFFSEIERFYK